MPQDDFKVFIQNAKEEYRKIGHVECPAFRGEKVYFTNKGFNHLIRKGHGIRAPHQQIRRIRLLKRVKRVLETTKMFSEHRVVKKINSTAHFWSFEKNIKGKNTVVIICQINKEPKKFLSIFDKKITENTKVPKGTL